MGLRKLFLKRLRPLGQCFILGWNGYYSFFDASIDEDTDGLYRIFGPTGQIDLLVSAFPM